MNIRSTEPSPKRRVDAAIELPLPVSSAPSTAPTNGGPLNAEPMLNFGGRYGKVSQSFFDSIVARAELRLPNLQSGELYNAEHLLGVSYWAAMTTDDCKRAGKCLAALVSAGLLPLTKHKVGHKTAWYYRIA